MYLPFLPLLTIPVLLPTSFASVLPRAAETIFSLRVNIDVPSQSTFDFRSQDGKYLFAAGGKLYVNGVVTKQPNGELTGWAAPPAYMSCATTGYANTTCALQPTRGPQTLYSARDNTISFTSSPDALIPVEARPAQQWSVDMNNFLKYSLDGLTLWMSRYAACPVHSPYGGWQIYTARYGYRWGYTQSCPGGAQASYFNLVAVPQEPRNRWEVYV
ncbi:MAG: hypothetical protein M1833_005273 [Piccolia ochrophora]|nr:MAG: hypothetical protein M1833_005273 [Piccolia ochrophora]